MRISDWSSDVCSSDLLVMTLARPEDEDGNTIPGLKGLGLFLIPRTLDDGTPNAYRIVRLKNKLGTRSMASAEIRMEGALAYAVGDLSRGFTQMLHQINMSRLDRTSVGKGKSVSVRVDLGGRGIIQKKK